jgi:hypothetical protein
LRLVASAAFRCKVFGVPRMIDHIRRRILQLLNV